MNNSEQMKYLPTYAEAKAYLDEVKPLKSGRHKGQKPWGRNRRATKLVAYEADCGSINVMLYKHNVLTYHPDDTVTLDLCGWPTPSTRDVFKYSLHLQTAMKAGTLCLFVGGKSYVFARPLRVDMKAMKVLNPDTQSVWRIDKKRMATLREEFTPFLTYCQAMGSIHERITKADIERAADHIQDNIPNPVYGSKLRHIKTGERYMGYGDIEYIQHTLGKIRNAQKVEDLEEYAARFTQVAVSASIFNWKTNEWIATKSFAQAVKEKFNEMLKYAYADVLFKKEVIEVGHAVADNNLKYIKHNPALCGKVHTN